MASSNIKLFDENKGNMLNDTEFNISTQRLNGLQTGVASSQLQNKAMYQASLIAYAIAQLMLANGKNANDTDAVSTFVNNLLASIVQKVADKATQQDVVDGVVGKWISSELFKSNNEAISAAISEETNARTAADSSLSGQLATIAANLGTQGHNCRIANGTYTGNGKYGESNPTRINCDFYPVIVIIAYETAASSSSESKPRSVYYLRDMSKGDTISDSTTTVTLTWENKSVSFYSSSASNQANYNGYTYRYFILGYDKDAEAAAG